MFSLLPTLPRVLLGVDGTLGEARNLLLEPRMVLLKCRVWVCVPGLLCLFCLWCVTSVVVFCILSVCVYIMCIVAAWSEYVCLIWLS